MSEDAQDVGRRTISRRYAEARADRPTETTKNEELFMIHAKTMKAERWHHRALM